MSVFLLVWSPNIQTLSPISLKFGKLICLLLDSDFFIWPLSTQFKRFQLSLTEIKIVTDLFIFCIRSYAHPTEYGEIYKGEFVISFIGLVHMHACICTQKEK